MYNAIFVVYVIGCCEYGEIIHTEVVALKCQMVASHGSHHHPIINIFQIQNMALHYTILQCLDLQNGKCCV